MITSVMRSKVGIEKYKERKRERERERVVYCVLLWFEGKVTGKG